MTKPETKSLTIEVKAEAEGIITAYAAAFSNTDSYGDVIQRGAFAKTIVERGPSGSKKVKVLYNHDTWEHLPVGVPQALSEDSYGLLTSTKMSKTQLGQDIYTLAQEGALSEMSIGYSAVKATYPDDEVNRQTGIWRIIAEAKLYEYSFVPFPANESAVITGVKNMADLEREIARWKTIAEVGMSAKAGRVLSGQNARRIQAALKELQDLLAEAGAEEAADDSTSTDATSEEKGNAEPPTHSPLLSALQTKARQLNAESRKSDLLDSLRRFGTSLRGNP